MRVHLLGLAVPLACAVVIVACSHEPPPKQPGAVTTTTSVEVGNAASRLASAHCKHASACNEVGGNRTYPTMEACMDKNRSDAADELRAANCPRGVDSPRLESCLAEINAESCTGIGSGFSRSMACTKGALCP